MKIARWVVSGMLLVAGSVAESAAADSRRDGEPRVRTATRVSSARADHRVRHSRRPVSRTRVQIGGFWYHGWGPGWSARWDPWYPRPWGYTTVYPQPGARYGALDTDVSPERAEVWVDGQQVGIADNFDGFPDFLWLPPGTYDVVFYLPGRRTLARQYTVYAGLVIDVEDRLEEGEAVHPLELGPQTHERRDERLRRDRELRDRAAELEWRPRAETAAPEALDARAEPGRLELGVTPDDASIYLDGRLLGSGRELAALRAGLLVDAGEHVLEFVRPGYQPERRALSVAAGGSERLEVELEPEAEPVN
jgi:hypothetical protein